MQRAANDVMQSILFAAVADAIAALKAASKGVPNILLRDLQTVHANTAFADLPKELQDSIAASVRSAFTALLKEGYTVAPREAAAPVRRPPPRHDTDRPRRPSGPPRAPRGDSPGRGPGGPGRGPGGPGREPGPGKGPRTRPPKGKPRLS